MQKPERTRRSGALLTMTLKLTDQIAASEQLARKRIHRMRIGGRGQRTFVHRVKVLGLVQGALVFSTGAPAAVGTKHDSLMSFHVALQVNNVALIQQRCEIDISYRQNRKKLSYSYHQIAKSSRAATPLRMRRSRVAIIPSALQF